LIKIGVWSQAHHERVDAIVYEIEHNDKTGEDVNEHHNEEERNRATDNYESDCVFESICRIWSPQLLTNLKPFVKVLGHVGVLLDGEIATPPVLLDRQDQEARDEN
jgi:hypothetical protein